MVSCKTPSSLAGKSVKPILGERKINERIRSTKGTKIARKREIRECKNLSSIE